MTEIKITKDERNVHKIGEKVVINIDQVQEMPLINVKNMVESWENYNESANDFVKEQARLLEDSIKKATEQGEKMLENANKLLSLDDEGKKKFTDNLLQKELDSAKKVVEGYDEIVKSAIAEVKKKHEELLIKVKVEIKCNEEGIKLYKTVL